MLQCRDVNHISRGRQRLHEMKTVIDVVIQCIKKKDEYFQRYIREMKNISELTYLFNEVKDIFQKINNIRNLTRMSQLNWESYVCDSRLFKLNIPNNHPLHDVVNLNEDISTNTTTQTPNCDIKECTVQTHLQSPNI